MTDTLLSAATFPFASEQTTWAEMMSLMYQQPQQQPHDGSGNASSSSSMDAPLSFGLLPDSFMSDMMQSIVSGGVGVGVGGVGPLITTADGVSLETARSGSSALLHEGGALLGADASLGGEGGGEGRVTIAPGGEALEQGSTPAAPSAFSSYEARSCVLEPAPFPSASTTSTSTSTSHTFEFAFTVPSFVSLSHSTTSAPQNASLSLPSTFQFTSNTHTIDPSRTTTTTSASSSSPSSTSSMSTSSIIFPSFELSTKRSAEERDNEFQGSAKKPRVVVASEETINPKDLCNTTPRSTSPPNRPPSPPRTHTCRPAVPSPLSSASTTPPPALNRPRRRSSRSNQIALLKFALDPWLRLSRNLGPQSDNGDGGSSCRPGIFNPATWPSAGNLRELRNSDPFSLSFGSGLGVDMGMGGMGMGVGDLNAHQWNLVDA